MQRRSLSLRGLRTRLPLAVAVVLGLTAATAHANEIEVMDLETCERSTLRVAEIVSEDWSKVMVRRTRPGKGPQEEIPTLTVVDIRRDGDDAIRAVATALARGNYQDAVDLGKKASGGGWRVNAETGERNFTSFSLGDPTKRGQRPSWKSEYAHFQYAKALALAGIHTRGGTKQRLLEEALLALDDRPVPGGEGTSGGFLGRFEGGNSRFYAEAHALLAQVLTALGRYDEAIKLYGTLDENAQRVPLLPRWGYEGLVGPARVAAAQKDLKKAVDIYNAASSHLLARLKSQSQRCLKLDLGRYYARARAAVIEARLDEATTSNNIGLFAKLKIEVEREGPKALEMKHSRAKPEDKMAILVGAQDPHVRAVSSIALGLAELKQKNFEAALIPLREVTVSHYRNRELAAQAWYHLAEAAEGAAGKARTDEAKAMWSKLASSAKETLKARFRDTTWGRK